MTPEELACWVADAPRSTRGSHRWRGRHARVLTAINETLETCAKITLELDSGRGNEKEIARTIRALKDGA